MKSIVLLALFALAANAAFNITAFGIGEAQQYGFTAEQIEQDAIPCFNTLDTSYANFVQLIQTKNIATILSGFSAMYEQFQTDVETSCHAYGLDVQAWFMKNSNTTDIVATMKHNFALYFAEIIQQVAIEINELIHGEYESAGAAKALADQILLGMVVPEVPPVPQFNYSQYVPFNQERFSNEYFTALFSAIGSNQTINGTEVDVCIGQLIAYTSGIEAFIGNFSFYNFADKIQAISNMFDFTGETVEFCEYYAQIFANVMAPLVSALEANPADFILQVVNNVAMNAPALYQSAQQEEIDILEGDYTSAGEEKGQRFVQIFGFAL